MAHMTYEQQQVSLKEAYNRLINVRDSMNNPYIAAQLDLAIQNIQPYIETLDTQSVLIDMFRA